MKNDRVPASVGIMIKKGNQVLLGRRKAYKEKSESWTFPGGALERGESLYDCAVREMFEETGLRANKLEFIGIIDDFNGAAHDHWVTINFLCEDFEGEPRAMEPEKIADWRWYEFDKLPDELWGPCQGTVRCFLDKEMYLQSEN